MAYENTNPQERSTNEGLYSKRLKAGKRRTYFFDVRTTKGNDYFLTITESKKRFNDNGYDRHKIFLYKEDFNKFLAALNDAVSFVKTELLPDFDFDQYNHEDYDHLESDEPESYPVEREPVVNAASASAPIEDFPGDNGASASETDDVDKW